MEAVLITDGTPSIYYLTKNGSVVCKPDSKQHYYFVHNTSDWEKDNTHVHYKGNKHIAGNHLEANDQYDIIGPCYWLNDRIESIECNIEIGQEFIYNGDHPNSTKGKKYIIDSYHVYRDRFIITYYNDEDKPSSISDLDEIIIREL